MSKKVIRIEGPDQVGYFRSKKSDYHNRCTDWQKELHIKMVTNHNSMPTPLDDGESDLQDIFDYSYKCSYKNNKEFEKWTKGVNLTHLIEWGFKIILLEVSECIEGENQTIFKEEHVISRTDISSLYL